MVRKCEKHRRLFRVVGGIGGSGYVGDLLGGTAGRQCGEQPEDLAEDGRVPVRILFWSRGSSGARGSGVLLSVMYTYSVKGYKSNPHMEPWEDFRPEAHLQATPKPGGKQKQRRRRPPIYPNDKVCRH